MRIVAATVSDATDAPTSLLPSPANAGSVARTTKTVRTEREDVAQDARVITLASVSVEISTGTGPNPVPVIVTALSMNGATLMKAGVLPFDAEMEIPPAHRVPVAINLRTVSRTVMVMVMRARR